jgi:predicted secreted protein
MRLSKNAKIALGVTAAAGIATGAYFLLRKPAATSTTPPSKGGGGGTTGGTLPAPHFVGPADDGGTTTLAVGDVLIASFPESSMTGNVWTMDESGAPLQSIVLPPEVAAAVGIRSFAYQAVQPGSASLNGTNTLPDGTTQKWSQAVSVTGAISTGGGGFHGGIVKSGGGISVVRGGGIVKTF